MGDFRFVGRVREQKWLRAIASQDAPSIVAVHGRRRVGKTTLLEHVFAKRGLWKFEGLENQSKRKQLQNVLESLSRYLNDPMIARLALSSWRQFFELLDSRMVGKGPYTIYFEEVQWLANYRTEFVAELKHVWDNLFRHRKKLVIVLCGSSPSFIINKVVKSKALYNRSMNHLALKPFSIAEAATFLRGFNERELLEAYLSVGGIPEYLAFLRKDSSPLLALCKNSFVPNSFFKDEYEKIFASSLSSNPWYRKTLEFLSMRISATREEIVRHLRAKSGGTLTLLLRDLEECGFVTAYQRLGSRTHAHPRYAIADNYVQFFGRFVRPIQSRINRGAFVERPLDALDLPAYEQWLGYALERHCRNNADRIAKHLGFSGVSFRDGAWFCKGNESQSGFQIDLCFDRDDGVLTVCEIKHQRKPIGTDVVAEFSKKIERLVVETKSNKCIQKVLITSGPVSASLIRTSYFDEILKLSDIVTEM
jgi:uncharacterized protein